MFLKDRVELRVENLTPFPSLDQAFGTTVYLRCNRGEKRDTAWAMVRRLPPSEKNGNTSESPIHSVFYHGGSSGSVGRARCPVLGGVFRGFSGGNQSGKKLNITPRSEGVHGVSGDCARGSAGREFGVSSGHSTNQGVDAGLGAR